MNRKGLLFFIVLVFVVLLVPLAGMNFWATTETTENTPLAEIPSAFTEENKPNLYYLSDWGNYFEDRFAFRPHLVTANALLHSKIFGQSATDQVVIGKDGWLFYGGTLSDYQGKNLLSQRDWFCLIHNLQLMQEYIEGQGSHFLLTIAPNKNSLYGKYMPSRYSKGELKNIDVLSEKLQEGGINYIDLYELFKKNKTPLYFKKDSHWHNKGAVLAYRVFMEAMGKKHETYLNVPCIEKKIHVGDLEEMLYPKATEPENDYVYQKERKFQCETTDYMTEWIETTNSEKEQTLLMYRDSFGESLLPFLAEEFNKGYFSRLVPYHLTQTEYYRPDYVIIERVERRLSSFAEEAPIMPAPKRENRLSLKTETKSEATIKTEGSYLSVGGTVDKSLIHEESKILVEIISADGKRNTYEPFYLTENGFQLYLKEETVPVGTLQINILTELSNQSVIICSESFTK